MKAATTEWIRKAEGDFRTAIRESRVRKKPNFDAVCFHAQQSIEESIKGMLTEWGIPFAKLHDLVKLSEPTWPRFPELRVSRVKLDLLSRYSVGFRYPGETATKLESREAIEALRVLRDLIRRRLKYR